MNISFLKEKKNKYIVFILLGILILVLAIPTNSGTEGIGTSTTEAVEGREMEQQLARVLSAMEGVGAVEVMITTETTESTLFGESSKSGKVCGVVVVAEGAGNATVESRILEAVKALFSIDAHKISIVKMSSQEGNR